MICFSLADVCRSDQVIPLARGTNECFLEVNDLLMLLVRTMNSMENARFDDKLVKYMCLADISFLYFIFKDGACGGL